MTESSGHQDKARERLVEQVKALRHEDECDVSRGRERPETGMAECNCLRADVLDLLAQGRRHRLLDLLAQDQENVSITRKEES